MEVVIDLGATVKLGAFSDQSPTDGGTGGGVDRDEFATRADGQAWVLAAEGEFANIRANPREQTLAPTAPGADGSSGSSWCTRTPTRRRPWRS